MCNINTNFRLTQNHEKNQQMGIQAKIHSLIFTILHCMYWPFSNPLMLFIMTKTNFYYALGMGFGQLINYFCTVYIYSIRYSRENGRFSQDKKITIMRNICKWTISSCQDLFSVYYMCWRKMVSILITYLLFI